MRNRLYPGQGMFMQGPGIELASCAATQTACMVYGAVLFGQPVPRVGLDLRGDVLRMRLTFDLVPSATPQLGPSAWHLLSLGGAVAYRF
jgi:hypothetical protein